LEGFRQAQRLRAIGRFADNLYVLLLCQGEAEAFPEEGMRTSDEHPDGEPASAAEQNARFPDHARVGLDHRGCLQGNRLPVAIFEVLGSHFMPPLAKDKIPLPHTAQSPDVQARDG